MNLFGGVHGVGPEIGFDGAGPYLLGMDEAYVGVLCHVLDSLFSNSIFVVSIGAIECNRLPHLADMVHPFFVSEATIVGMIMLDDDPKSLCI